MRLRACFALLLFLSACASAPPLPSMPRPHAFVPTPPSGPNIRLVSAPMEPSPQQSRIGKADLDQARALLSRARNELEPRQWDALNRKLTAAEQAFECFSRAAKTSGQAAEVVRGRRVSSRLGEQRLAEACGYGIAVGVRNKAHKIALERADSTLKVILMDWC